MHRSRVWLMEPPVDVRLDRPDDAGGRSFRHEHGIGDDELAVVVVSRLDVDLKAEGIGYAMRAVATLDLPELRLVVVGDGNAADDLRAEADRVNAALGRPAVVLTGALVDPRPAYAAADVMLGMGGSALRCLAHGKPLVVLGERGFARTFVPETVGYFSDAGFFGDEREADPVGHLAGLLRELLPEERRKELGEFGLAEVSLRTLSPLASRWAYGSYVLGRALAHEARRRAGR